MLQIGFGLLLYKLLHWIFVAVIVVFLVPFLLNLADGKGYWVNFKEVWKGISWLFRMGTAKRNHICTRAKGHGGPCNGFQREDEQHDS